MGDGRGADRREDAGEDAGHLRDAAGGDPEIGERGRVDDYTGAAAPGGPAASDEDAEPAPRDASIGP